MIRCDTQKPGNRANHLTSCSANSTHLDRREKIRKKAISPAPPDRNNDLNTLIVTGVVVCDCPIVRVERFGSEYLET